ncbi:MAG: hypothetical protein MJA83_12725, partial [Gammaproteobacteria bacterium]|nr:hypothetical protein [Gammaproteobacteria bacterium]
MNRNYLKYLGAAGQVLMLSIVWTCGAHAQSAVFQQKIGDTKELAEDAGFKTPAVMAFDSENRPYIMNATLINDDGDKDAYEISILRDHVWLTHTFRDDLEAALPAAALVNGRLPVLSGLADSASVQGGNQMVIDDNDRFYAIVSVKRNDSTTGSKVSPVLIYAEDVSSPDFDGTFDVHDIFDLGDQHWATLETRNSQGEFSLPPVIMYSEPSSVPWTYNVPLSNGSKFLKARVINTKINGDGTLDTSETQRHDLTDRNILFTSHSGGHGVAATKNGVTYLVYQEVLGGNNGTNYARARSLNRSANTISAQEAVMTLDPGIADGHSTPTLGIDSSGHIHVQGGSHEQNGFPHAKSTNAED